MTSDVSSSPRGTLVMFGLLIIAIIIGMVLVLRSRPDPVQITINPPIPTATAAPTNTPEPILVYITGAVHEPETTITLPYGSRVSDAIEAVGGVTDDADLERVNLAGLVRDGDQIHVPSLQDAVADSDESSPASELPTPSGGEVVYINTATLEELQTLPGIGPTTAQSIIDYRDANGAYTSLEDLDNVSGIGPSTLEEIEPFISFE
jgi:competence protein ComEA